ncbi:DUF6493 family protein [Nonomuraea sp. NPDC046802]|uniref:DUF7824 domain-containing protein n=1 Tax=Nonomuraea sp. NPDC046802 TaxID=3154919 RepID=UPI0034081458
MTNAWDAVRAAIDAEDADAVATLLTGYDDGRRREVARELPGYVPIAREAGERRDAERRRRRENRWETLARRAEDLGRHVFGLAEAPAPRSAGPVDSQWREVMRVAGAGSIAGAAAVVTWLNKRDFERPWVPDEADDVPQIVRVVAARPPAWQQNLATRLALRLRGTSFQQRDRRVHLALALLRDTGVEPPEHDPLTLAWLAATPPADLAADPLLDAMLPRLFESEGVSRALWDDRGLAAALTALAAGGRITRAALLDGCRTRFLRGGQAADQRFFVRLHELLDPTPEEIAPHARDYAALLAPAPANVAELALRQLRRLGGTPPAEAVEGLLYRSEGKLVRAGLTLLDRVLKESPETAPTAAASGDVYASALAVALICKSADARARAVKLAIKYAERFSPLGAETIRDVVPLLPPVQGAELASVFGGEPAVFEPVPGSAPFVPVPLPAAPVPDRMPMPIARPITLARLQLPEYDWIQAEWWLDGFVRLASGDERDALATALTPLATRCLPGHYRDPTWRHPIEWAAAMARELSEPGAERRAVPDSEVDPARRLPEMTHGPVWQLMPVTRFAEVYRALVEDRLPPYLLATPTRINGLLDADVLVERLEGYERAGATALPIDLRQALLRLSRAVTEEVAARASRLTGEAGRTVHRWLTDRPAEPEVVLRWGTHQSDVRIMSEFVCGPEYAQVIGDLLVPRLHDEAFEQLLAVFAGHRELAAARSVYTLMSHWPVNKPSLRDLELLTLGDGPGGPGLALLLAHFLVEGPDGGAVEPLLRLAAAGDLPGPELGRQLAIRLDHGDERLSDALAALRAAAERGAHRQVWQVMTGLLPAYLPGPGERATSAHTRLVMFASELAEWADARGELAVVGELAGRPRETELVRQARHLHTRLTTAAS